MDYVVINVLVILILLWVFVINYIALHVQNQCLIIILTGQSLQEGGTNPGALRIADPGSPLSLECDPDLSP